MVKLRNKNRITKAKDIDSVRRRWQTYGENRDPELLDRCERAWHNLEQFRKDRDRCLRYMYGDQWGDMIRYQGRFMSEKNYIEMRKDVPLVNNVMRPLLNVVTGLYAKQDTEPICFARDRDDQAANEMMSTTLQANWQLNKMSDLLNTTFEEYCISGCAVVKEIYDSKDDVLSAWTETPNPYYMFWEGGSDPRHNDITLIGEIHDLDKNTLIATFVKPEYGITVDKLMSLYYGSLSGQREYDSTGSLAQWNERNSIRRVSFRSPDDPRKFRVIECWSQETKVRWRCWDVAQGKLYKIDMEDKPTIDAINEYRIKVGTGVGMNEEDIPLIETEQFVDVYWYYKFMTPTGDVLVEGETPYFHKSHPYTMKLYPYVNGEIHSFAATFIDQQRYINRLITLNDFILRTKAKGVKIIPSNMVPDDMTAEEFAEQLTAVDGLIIYKPRKDMPNLKPEIIYSNSSDVGISEMLQLQLQLVDKISNVQGALQGKTPQAGTSGVRYGLEMQNATTSLAAILMKFSSFTEDIAKKKVKVIQQYYEDGKPIATQKTGSSYVSYKADLVRNLEFGTSIKESTSSPVYRQFMNDYLLNFLQLSGGMINIMDVLRYGDFPFADKLLQDLESRQQQAQGVGQAAGMENEQPVDPIMDANLMRQISANQQSVRSAQNLLESGGLPNKASVA